MNEIVTLARIYNATCKRMLQTQAVKKITVIADQYLKGQEQGWSRTFQRLGSFLIAQRKT